MFSSEEFVSNSLKNLSKDKTVQVNVIYVIKLLLLQKFFAYCRNNMTAANEKTKQQQKDIYLPVTLWVQVEYICLTVESLKIFLPPEVA